MMVKCHNCKHSDQMKLDLYGAPLITCPKCGSQNVTDVQQTKLKLTKKTNQSTKISSLSPKKIVKKTTNSSSSSSSSSFSASSSSLSSTDQVSIKKAKLREMLQETELGTIDQDDKSNDGNKDNEHDNKNDGDNGDNGNGENDNDNDNNNDDKQDMSQEEVDITIVTEPEKEVDDDRNTNDNEQKEEKVKDESNKETIRKKPQQQPQQNQPQQNQPQQKPQPRKDLVREKRKKPQLEKEDEEEEELKQVQKVVLVGGQEDVNDPIECFENEKPNQSIKKQLKIQKTGDVQEVEEEEQEQKMSTTSSKRKFVQRAASSSSTSSTTSQKETNGLQKPTVARTRQPKAKENGKTGSATSVRKTTTTRTTNNDNEFKLALQLPNECCKCNASFVNVIHSFHAQKVTHQFYCLQCSSPQTFQCKNCDVLGLIQYGICMYCGEHM